jgi:predicted DsbA family dithiol-disulfide isomerase
MGEFDSMCVQECGTVSHTGGSVNEPLTVDVYIDFVCPFVHAGTKWLQEVQRQLGPDNVTFNWRFFPLEQVNAPADIEETVWDLPPENRSQARNSMHAAIAAMQQGNDAFERFMPALLALKHEEGKDHGKQATLEEAAQRAGLDMERFRADLGDRSLLTRIRDDYLHGRNEHGVVGTPTLVFPNGEAAYIQVRPAPGPEDAVPLWNDVVRVIERPLVHEIKRPRKP